MAEAGRLKIFIEKGFRSPLALGEIKYAFVTLLTIAGYPFHFVNNPGKGVDIWYGKEFFGDCAPFIFIKALAAEKRYIKEPVDIINIDSVPFFTFVGRDCRKDTVLRKGGCYYIYNDIIFSIFYLLSGWQEKFIRRDDKDRHEIRDSFLFRSKLLSNAPVNRYAIYLQKLLISRQSPIPSWPSDKKYAVALSHDVDYPEMVPLIETLRYLLMYRNKASVEKVFGILAGKESFWKFEEWIHLEKKYNVRSAFYFCGFRGNLVRYLFKAPDPFYDIDKPEFQKVLHMLKENGFEIGMHSSYLAYESEKMFRDEKKRIERVFNSPIFGNRHHYWHMNPDHPIETARIHETIGLVYDSSLSFERRAGFRRGICSPFHLYDSDKETTLKVSQLPPTLMDDHLFGYARYSHFKNWQMEIDALLNTIREVNGVLVTDYHQRVLNRTFYPGWGESFEYLINKISATNNFYCDTPIAIVRHWLAREQKIKDASIDEVSCNH